MSTKWPHPIDISPFINDTAVEEVVDEIEEVNNDEVDPKQSEPLRRVYCSLD